MQHAPEFGLVQVQSIAHGVDALGPSRKFICDVDSFLSHGATLSIWLAT
jgi:hypothetical protein